MFNITQQFTQALAGTYRWLGFEQPCRPDEYGLGPQSGRALVRPTSSMRPWALTPIQGQIPTRSWLPFDQAPGPERSAALQPRDLFRGAERHRGVLGNSAQDKYPCLEPRRRNLIGL